MVYIFGGVGFVIGFAVGLGTLNVLLHNRKIEDVKKDKSAKSVYGLSVWGLSAIGAWLGVTIYNVYFY